MRSLCLLVVLTVIPAALANEQGTDKVLDPAAAIKLAKDLKVTVKFEVKSVSSSKNKEHWWLNSEADYKDGKNFTVFIPKSMVEEFKKKSITDPEKAFKGKTLQVTGYLG